MAIATVRFWQVALYYTFLTIMSWAFYEMAQEYYIDFDSTYWYYLFFIATLFFATLIILYQERYMKRTIDENGVEVTSHDWKNELVIYIFGALVFIFITTGVVLSTFNSTLWGYIWISLGLAVFLTIFINTLQALVSRTPTNRGWVRGLMLAGVILYSILYIVAILLLFIYYSPPIWVYTPLIAGAIIAIISGMLEIWGSRNIDYELSAAKNGSVEMVNMDSREKDVSKTVPERKKTVPDCVETVSNCEEIVSECEDE